MNRARLSSAGFDDEDLRRTRRDGALPSSGPVGDPAPVGRKTRIATSRREQHGIASQRRDHVDCSAVLFGPEGDPGPVGRKGGIRFVGRIVGETDRIECAELLKPDVEIARAAAIGGERDQTRILRKRGKIVQPVGRGQHPVHRFRGRSFGRGGKTKRGAWRST